MRTGEDATTPSGDPLVSVLTPSHNQVRWLRDNLDSVAAQTYPWVEHIVMDGGSDDGSVAVLEALAGPHVRWRSEPDSGQSDAINKAYGEARGEILGWLNSDDAYFTADTVALVVDAFRRHPDADIVYGHAALVNADGLILQVTWAPPMWDRLLRIHNFIIQPTAFVRKRAVEGQLVRNEFESMMDRELWLRLSDRHKFVRVNRILAIDRDHPDRKTTKSPEFQVRDQRRLDALRATPSGPLLRPTRKVLKVLFRLAGLMRIKEAMRASVAFEGGIDSGMSLVIRQAITPRSRMPSSTPLPGTERDRQPH